MKERSKEFTRRQFITFVGKGIGTFMILTSIPAISEANLDENISSIDKMIFNLYIQRFEKIKTATINANYLTKYYKAGTEPEDNLSNLLITGKIDYIIGKSKMRVIMEFDNFKNAFEIEKNHNNNKSQHKFLKFQDNKWIIANNTKVLTTNDNPESSLLRQFFFIPLNSTWKYLNNSKEIEIDIHGNKQKKEMRYYKTNFEPIEFVISTDAEVVNEYKLQQGKSRSEGTVIEFIEEKPVGLIPQKVLLKQYDSSGDLFREMQGIINVKFNEPDFTYDLQ